MTDYGRIGRLIVEHPTDTSFPPLSASVFMVVAESEEEAIRSGIPDWRWTFCLSGCGIWGGGLVRRGRLIPVRIDDRWLEDAKNDDD